VGFGSIVNSCVKNQSLYFDCADVNFTDGIYATDVIIKNNAILIITGLKFFQDTSAYPALNIIVFTDSAFSFPTLLFISLPLFNTPNQYSNSNTGGGNLGFVNNNNCTISVQLQGITGSGVTSLSFEVYILYVEMDF
jgi:hypothetical protein